MIKIRMYKFYILILILLNTFCTQAFSSDTFSTFIERISIEAKEKGVTSKVINDFKSKVSFIPRVVELDRSQPEFKLTLDQYLSRVVTSSRIKKANLKFKIIFAFFLPAY